MLELVGDFFGRKKKCVGAGISGGGHQGPTRQGGPPFTLVARWMPPVMFSVPNILKYSKISYLNFRAFGELLFSGYFLVHG